MIRATYSYSPNFSPADQHPNALRKTWVGTTRTWVVDYTDAEPTSEEIRLLVEPTQAEIDARNLATSCEQARLKASEKFDPQAKVMRVGLRLLLQKLNASLPVGQRTTWPQFMQQWKALIDSEADPES